MCSGFGGKLKADPFGSMSVLRHSNRIALRAHSSRNKSKQCQYGMLVMSEVSPLAFSLSNTLVGYWDRWWRA